MTLEIIELTEAEFDAQFPLLPNHLNPNATWCFDEDRGCLFETYGQEFEFVRQQNPQSVWTLVDGEHDTQYLLSGIHFVNRIGYLVSAVALPKGTEIEVRLDASG